MSVDYKCRQIYNDVIHDVTKTEEAWKSVLSLCGRIYRYEFDNVLMVYAQRPKSTLIADFDTWKKVDRYVKRGSKGIAIYPSRALSPYCRYVFDISDTGGRNVKLTWNLEGDYLTDYAKRLAGEGSITLTGNESPVDLKNKIWDFTKSEVRGILREKHAMRVSVLAGKLGDQIVSSRQDVRDDGLQIIERSIFCVVAGRCGFDQLKGENELGTITQIVKEDMIFELGSLVSDVSCEVLRNISRSIKEIERERRMSYERGTTVQRGSRRDAVSEHRNGEGKSVTNREIRSDGDGLSKGEPLREVSVSGEIRETDRDSGSAERGSVSDGGTDDGAVSAVPSGEEPGRHDGDVENQRAGTEADTGDHRSRSDQQVPLESETVKADETPHAPNDGAKGEYHQISFMDMMAPPDNEFDRELKELESFGEKRGADAASLFSHVESVLSEQEKEDLKAGRHTYLNPKKEPVPEEYIKSVVLRGTGFVGGEKRVYEIMQSEFIKSERIKKIRAEYGIGGSGWPMEGYGLHGYDTFKAKGIRFQWRDEEGEKEGYVDWNTIEEVISALILTGEYYTPENEFVDAVEELDEFAIPDEVSDMGIPDNKRALDEHNEDAWYGMAPEELAGEDETVTFSEYGREFTDEESYHEKIREMSGKSDKSTVSADEDELLQNSSEGFASDFHMSPFATQSAGMMTRYDWNIKALRTLKQIQTENRAATHKEQEILSKYVGWGGLSQAFDANNKKWAKEYGELKALLTPEEYKAAKATVNNAFYTPSIVASAIGNALVQFGFKEGNILEPSLGVGNFFGCLPGSMSQAKLFGVEIDPVSAEIAKLLYPSAKIEIKGFEKTAYPDNFFDAVIGNVPFGDYKVFDPKYNKLNFKIHDYFLAKSIDQVRPGGVVAVITVAAHFS